MFKYSAVAIFVLGSFAASANAEPISSGRPVTAATIPTALNLSFTGQCDGLAITIDPSTAIAHATRTGCLTGDLTGTLGILVTSSSTSSSSAVGTDFTASQTESITLAEDYTDAEAANNTLMIINTNMTFSVYHIPDMTLVNSGTYTVTGGSGGGGRGPRGG